MNLNARRVSFFFAGCLGFTLLIPAFFPWMRLAYFIPFLIVLFYKKPFNQCLWGSIGCGLILDLLAPQPRLGLNAVAFTLTTLILYPQRRHFFADSLSTLPLMTLFYSIISSVMHVILIHIFDKSIPLSKIWVIKDIFVMPCFDAAFAFFFYVLPFLIFGKRTRAGKDYFLQED